MFILTLMQFRALLTLTCIFLTMSFKNVLKEDTCYLFSALFFKGANSGFMFSQNMMQKQVLPRYPVNGCCDV